MKFGPVALEEAEGAIVAHTLRLSTGVLKKGSRLGAEELARLRLEGHSMVVAARVEPGDLAEDEAARRLAGALASASIRAAEASTGRCNLYARSAGLVLVDSARLLRLNTVDEGLTLATARAYTVVRPGDMVGTVKIIPFAVPESCVDAACEITEGASVLAVRPFEPREAGIVLTRLPGVPEGLLDRAARAQRARLRRLGAAVIEERRCEHDPAAVASAIEALADAGRDPVLLLGASAIVDRGDVLPRALQLAGGEVEHLGMPVDPGNLLMLGHRGATVVIGVPGCARSLKRSGFDKVLERVIAGLIVRGRDLAAMAEGGLLRDDPERPHPRRTERDRAPVSVAAVVLAAGRSRRMGVVNKLLEEVDGRPMIDRVVEAAAESAAHEVIVVTGHDERRVRDALVGREVRFAHNPEHVDGMSTSVRVAIDAVADAHDGALFLLGDMPWVQPDHLDRLIASFHADGGSEICVPVYQRKRGNPVLWPSRYFEDMRSLVGDVGARHLLSEHADAVRLVEMNDAGVLVDVDTPAALEALSAGRDPS